MRESEEFVHVVPGEHLGQRVGAGDEEKLVLRPGGGAQIAQRVDGVGGPGPVDVDPADAEPGVRRGGDHRHQVAVLGGRDGTEILLVRLAGRHEDDLVQREVVRDLAGGDQVTMMYGIEGSAHHADASHFFMPPLRASYRTGPTGPHSGYDSRYDFSARSRPSPAHRYLVPRLRASRRPFGAGSAA